MHASSKMGMPGLQMKYFVLKPGGRTDYHRASRLAMLVYATEIRQENPVLAAELETWSYAEEKSAASAQEWAKDQPAARHPLLDGAAQPAAPDPRDAEIARLTEDANVHRTDAYELRKEVARLTEALAAAESAKAEWERLRNEAYSLYRAQAERAEAAGQKLAEAERLAADAVAANQTLLESAESAEARVRELEAELARPGNR